LHLASRARCVGLLASAARLPQTRWAACWLG
jgi:hypothetical protein